MRTYWDYNKLKLKECLLTEFFTSYSPVKCSSMADLGSWVSTDNLFLKNNN